MTDTLPATPVKPGYLTTEFYGTWAVKILGALMGTGVLGDGSPASRVVGGVLVVLGLLGYTYSRTVIKAAAASMLAVALVVASGASLIACNPTSPLHPVVDCTVADQTQLQALISELQPLLAGNNPDWTSIERDAVAAGETIGGCALATVIQTYLAPPAGVAAHDPLSGQLAHAVLEDYRTRYAGGSTFHTHRGDL